MNNTVLQLCTRDGGWEPYALDEDERSALTSVPVGYGVVLSTVTDLTECAVSSHYSVQCDIRPVLFVRHHASCLKPRFGPLLNLGSLFVVYTKHYWATLILLCW